MGRRPPSKGSRPADPPRHESPPPKGSRPADPPRNASPPPPNGQSFRTTAPAVLTAVAGVVAAISAVIGTLAATGVLNRPPPSPTPTVIATTPTVAPSPRVDPAAGLLAIPYDVQTLFLDKQLGVTPGHASPNQGRAEATVLISVGAIDCPIRTVESGTAIQVDAPDYVYRIFFGDIGSATVSVQTLADKPQKLHEPVCIPPYAAANIFAPPPH